MSDKYALTFDDYMRTHSTLCWVWINRKLPDCVQICKCVPCITCIVFICSIVLVEISLKRITFVIIGCNSRLNHRSISQARWQFLSHLAMYYFFRLSTLFVLLLFVISSSSTSSSSISSPFISSSSISSSSLTLLFLHFCTVLFV